MNKYNFISFLFFSVVTFLSSIVGSFITLSFKEPWYSSLNKPFFNPPDWIFGPVWSILYLFMSIAIWKVWIESKQNKKIVYLYFLHLFFNTTWSIIFFGFQNILLSLLNLIFLIYLIVILTIKYKNISKISVILMIPYIVWCCFALLLNFSIFLLN